MLLTNGSVKCDGCGRLSRHPEGEYRKPDGSVGYINSKGFHSAKDWCDECVEAAMEDGRARDEPK